jgi:putative sterol carrier protein
VGHFKDESDVYAFIGRLFQELAADPELAPKFKNADTIVQYQMRDPESQITVYMCPDEEMQVDLGPSDLDPEVVMTMDADTAHGFWLGRVNVTVALARGQIKARGPVAKILRLVPLVKPSFPRYEQMLRDAGRTDLLEAA